MGRVLTDSDSDSDEEKKSKRSEVLRSPKPADKKQKTVHKPTSSNSRRSSGAISIVNHATLDDASAKPSRPPTAGRTSPSISNAPVFQATPPLNSNDVASLKAHIASLQTDISLCKSVPPRTCPPLPVPSLTRALAYASIQEMPEGVLEKYLAHLNSKRVV